MTEETKQQTDYFGRANRLVEAESKEWFKCTEGKHTILFLSEGTPYEQEWEGETIQKLRFDVEVKGKPYSLSVTEGQTKSSFYGQLLMVATKLKPTNQLKDKTITLIVVGDGKKKRYTVVEAAGLDEEKLDIRDVKIV